MTHNSIMPQQEQFLQTAYNFVIRTRNADGWYEFRLLGPDKPVTRWWQHGNEAALQKALDECLRWNERGYNVYITMNPCAEQLDGSAGDAHIARRILILIDSDTTRPKLEINGKLTNDIPSTYEEQRAAVTVIRAVLAFLAEHEITPLVLVDSGNGAQLYLQCDLPNDELATKLVHKLLQLLDKRFATDTAHIDTSVANASRIARVPGFVNYKGAELPDRPFRRSRVVKWYDNPTVVDMPTLESLVNDLQEKLGILQEQDTQPERNGKPQQKPDNNGAVSPADWFNQHITLNALVALAERHGYKPVGQRDEYFEMTRPGKDAGISGGFTDKPGVWCYHNFSGNDPYMDEYETYSAFEFYARLEHGGDMSDAARAVVAGIQELGIPPMTSADDTNSIKQVERLLREAGKLLKEVKAADKQEQDKVSHIDIAEKILQEFRFVSFGPDAEELWRYDSTTGVWKSDATAFIEHILRTRDILADGLKRRSFLAEVVEHIRGVVWQPWHTLPEPPPTLIPFRNGVLDLNTGDLREYRPEDYFTSRLPWNYNPEATSAVIQQRLAAFPAEIQQHFMELLAYCLYRDYPLQRFFIWTGAGNNGKSYLFRLLVLALGSENIAGETMHSIAENRFAAANLHRKLANIAGEVKASDLTDTDMLKRLTGGDWMSADRKFLSPIRFKNYAKLVFSMNAVPPTTDSTDAFYRRTFIVEFKHQFKEDPRVETELSLLPNEQLEQEFSWLLTQAVETLKTLFVSGFALTGEKPTEQKRQQYEDLSKPLRNFINEYCIRTDDPDDLIPKFELRERLNEYLKARKLTRYTDHRIAKEMQELGIQDRRSSDEKRWWCWEGLKWKDAATTDTETSAADCQEQCHVKDVKDVNLSTTLSREDEIEVENYRRSNRKVGNLDILDKHTAPAPDECDDDPFADSEAEILRWARERDAGDAGKMTPLYDDPSEIAAYKADQAALERIEQMHRRRRL